MVRTPQAARLREALEAEGARVAVIAADRLEIGGVTAERAATIAAEHRLPIFEIGAQADSLEDAFLRATSAPGRPR